MKNVSGVWLPDGEQHFAKALAEPNPGRRLVNDVAAYGYEQLERAVKRCTQRRRCVDAGAHVGMWSMWLVSEFEQVEAFEPVSEYAQIFPFNMNGAKNWKLHPVALGQEYGSVDMKLYPENTGQAHVCGRGEMAMLPLDHYHYRDVDLLKIDVEGYELPLVKGAQQTILASRPIVVLEQRGLDQERFGETRDSALHWLTRYLGMRPLEQVHCDWILGW